MTQDVLFELGTEELPSGLVDKLGHELLSNVLKAFDEAHLSYESSQYFSTPRRLAFLIQGVPNQLPKRQIVRRGPQEKAGTDEAGNPSQALLGFARSCKVDVSELKLVATEKGACWEYQYEEPGALTTAFLVTTIQAAVKGLTIPKPMRWGNSTEAFARPIHWAVLIYGDAVIPASFFGIETNRLTYGHRFMHPGAIALEKASEYEQALKAGFVVADFNKRRADIIQQIEILAHEKQRFIPMHADLIHEITSIVEWPVVMIGAFDEEFLTVPAPVLIASMQHHQKCLPVYDKSNHLLPFFITVSNLASQSPEQVRIGNEKVMRARLSDAMFFYQQDRQIPLIDYAPLTEKVIFEQRLGSLADKTERSLAIALYLAKVFDVSEAELIRAVQLSKCDLMTGLVGEFPELQGTIGQFYAAGDGEKADVASALFEQYLPRFSGDELPKTDLGFILSLADRLDTLVGIFAIGLKPTGEKDPYKLRRHALAVVRLLLSRPNQLDIEQLLKLVAKQYSFLDISDKLLSEVKQFMIERMQSYFTQQDYPVEWFNAGLAVQSQCWYDLACRLESFSRFMQSEQSHILAQSAKRVKQILSSNEYDVDSLSPTLFQEVTEKELWNVVQNISEEIKQAIAHQRYDEGFQALLCFANPLANFFEQVFVMCEDLNVRKNRLSLLAKIQHLLQSIVMIGL
jgi:glycyl-tRNA synthetase beta chain